MCLSYMSCQDTKIEVKVCYGLLKYENSLGILNEKVYGNGHKLSLSITDSWKHWRCHKI